MKLFPQSAKYYKKTAALTDVIAVAIIWAVAIYMLPGILSVCMMIVLNLWIFFSGPLFTNLGEWAIKNRNEDKD